MGTSIYSKKILLTMIDTMLDFLIENDGCQLCRIYKCQDNRCSNTDLCKNLMFDGVLNKALKNTK